MIVGTISYEAHSGLGHLARDFIHHGIVHRILVIPHPNYTNYNDWYSSDQRFTLQNVKRFLDGLDVLLLFENAFKWNVADQSRSRGAKIVMVPNYEYTPFPMPVRPDLVLCPSLLDVEYYYRDYLTDMLPIPIDLAKHPWRLRQRAEVFVHNAGHGGRGYREGTPELLEAMKHVKSPIKLIIRAQTEEPRMRDLFKKKPTDPRIELRLGQAGDTSLWAEGDVGVAPQKYNGVSLPLQEAFAAGLAIVTTKRWPMTSWLPQEPMIPVDHYETDRIAVVFDRAVLKPEAIAETIDSLYGRDISSYSELGRDWSLNHSWESLGPRYQAILEEVCR